MRELRDDEREKAERARSFRRAMSDGEPGGLFRPSANSVQVGSGPVDAGEIQTHQDLPPADLDPEAAGMIGGLIRDGMVAATHGRVEKAATAPLAVKTGSRYTLSAVYVAASEGGHPSAEELEQATWQFDRGGDFSVHDADSGAQVGEVVEIAFNRSRAEGGFASAPENSVCVGIIWTPEAFPRAASGEIRPRLGGAFRDIDPSVTP